MGILKDNLKEEESRQFLIKLGFRYGDIGAQGESGYTKIIPHDENEILWITINLQEKKVYLYNEWDCGGKLWERTYDIPFFIENKTEFINWLDAII